MKRSLVSRNMSAFRRLDKKAAQRAGADIFSIVGHFDYDIIMISERPFSKDAYRIAMDAADVRTWDLDPVSNVRSWCYRTKAMFGIAAEVHWRLPVKSDIGTADRVAYGLGDLTRGGFAAEIGREDGRNV